MEPIGVEVKAHNEAWIKDQEMGSFLSVSQGSAEKPVFLEMSYNNSGIESSSPVGKSFFNTLALIRSKKTG